MTYNSFLLRVLVDNFMLLAIPTQSVPSNQRRGELFVTTHNDKSLSVPRFVPVKVGACVVGPQRVLCGAVLFFLAVVVDLLFVQLTRRFGASIK